MISRKAISIFGIFAILVLSLAFSSAVSPTVSSLSITSNAGSDNTYSLGNLIQVTVVFSEAVTVNTVGGTPYVTLTVGSISRNANYISGSTTTNLVFSYTVQAGDTDSNGISILANKLFANGSTIRNGASEDATLTHLALADNSSHKVDTSTVFNPCPVGVVGNLRISDFQVNNFGEGDDEEWQPLDKVEIEVEIENTHSTDDIKDVNVEIIIKDSNGNDITNDFDITDEKIDVGRIRDDESELVTFEIPEVPADLSEGNYKIYIKAYSDGDENTQCVDESSDFNSNQYHQVEFTRTDDVAVVVRGIDDKLTASCGERDVLFSFPIYNIGTDKEEKVLVSVSNRDLEIEEYVVVDNLREGKKKDVDFFLNFPSTATKEIYDLDIVTYFDYDGDGDELDISSYDSNSADDLDENYEQRVELLGCVGNAPTIGATLDSSAVVGQDLIITATVRNNGAAAGDFVISVSGISGWADFVSATPQTLSLSAGSSGESLIKLSPTAGGFRTFMIEVTSNGKTYTQPVSVTIEEKSGGIFGVDLDNNILYYVIGALAVLILVFIIMIIRVSRRPSAD